MKKFAAVLTFLVLLALPAFSQTFKTQSNNFTFDKNQSIVTWDGSDLNNPPYPDEMGSVSFTGNQQGIVVPFQLNYLNNGYLVPCNPLSFGQITWTKGNGTHSGDTYIKPGTTTCPYFTGEYGTYEDSNNTYDGFSVVAQYVRTFVLTHPRFHPPVLVPVDTLQGGTGVITQTVVQ